MLIGVRQVVSLCWNSTVTRISRCHRDGQCTRGDCAALAQVSKPGPEKQLLIPEDGAKLPEDPTAENLPQEKTISGRA